MLQKAIDIATIAHYGQKDKAGASYISHPVAVSGMVDTEDEKITALLHDVIEDTPWTLHDLELEGFAPHILQALACLTHNDGEDYFDYLRRVKQNPLATRVKLADLTHNSDLSRISSPSQRDYERVEKYKRAMEYFLT